jgi:hypothetical protein
MPPFYMHCAVTLFYSNEVKSTSAALNERKVTYKNNVKGEIYLAFPSSALFDFQQGYHTYYAISPMQPEMRKKVAKF